jgi:hypothetical protein
LPNPTLSWRGFPAIIVIMKPHGTMIASTESSQLFVQFAAQIFSMNSKTPLNGP